MNLVEELPPELGALARLRRLKLKKNLIREFPREIGNLSSLEELLISDNQFTNLPRTIGQLKKLTVRVFYRVYSFSPKTSVALTEKQNVSATSSASISAASFFRAIVCSFLFKDLNQTGRRKSATSGAPTNSLPSL